MKRSRTRFFLYLMPVRGLCCINLMLGRLPLPRTALSYGLGDGYAKRCLAVEGGDTDVVLCDLTFEVPRHQRLAE